MDILALLLYIILAIILITLIIVIGWLYYDYVELKDNLNSNFSYVRRKFDDHDEKNVDLENDIDDNYTDIYEIKDDINKKPEGIKDDIKDIKAILGEPASEDGTTAATGFYKVKDLVGGTGTSANNWEDGSGLMQTSMIDLDMKSKFHSNLNKYFEFGTAGAGLNDNWPAGEGGKELTGNMWFRLFDDANENDKKLKLIQNTTIAANMTVNTDDESRDKQYLKICNNKTDTDKVCYKLYVDDDGDLNIQSGNGGTANSKLVMGEYTVDLPAGVDTSTTRKSLIAQAHTHKYDKYNIDTNVYDLTDTTSTTYT